MFIEAVKKLVGALGFSVSEDRGKDLPQVDGFESLDRTTLVPIDPKDRALLRMASLAQMSNTTLPSGAVVPDAPEGQSWIVLGDQLKLENVRR